MNEDIDNLRTYRLNEAKERLDAAGDMIALGKYKDSINRSYYAIFNALRSVLALDRVDFKHHAQVIGYFNKEYIHTGKFDIKYVTIINNAFQIRNNCDYDDFYIASKADAEEQYKNAEDFLKSVSEYQKTIK